MYRTIFFFTIACETRVGSPYTGILKMRRNLTSLNSCNTTSENRYLHLFSDDVNIVTVCVARRRCKAPLEPRKPYVNHCAPYKNSLQPRAIILHPRASILRPRAIILHTGAGSGHFRWL